MSHAKVFQVNPIPDSFNTQFDKNFEFKADFFHWCDGSKKDPKTQILPLKGDNYYFMGDYTKSVTARNTERSCKVNFLVPKNNIICLYSAKEYINDIVDSGNTCPNSYLKLADTKTCNGNINVPRLFCSDEAVAAKKEVNVQYFATNTKTGLGFGFYAYVGLCK